MRKNGYNMGRDKGNRSPAARKGKDSLWAGILVGVLTGVAMAVGVAWYIMKSPKPFLNKEQPAVAKPQSETTKPAIPAAAEKSATTPADGKPRFEFYKVLTDKQSATVPASTKLAPKPVEKPKAQDNKMVAAYEPQVLQAGSFSNANDAEKLKAKLALLGVEANIQTATIPEKGVWYRVRLGPYKNPDEMNRASNFLKQNGVDSTPMRAQ